MHMAWLVGLLVGLLGLLAAADGIAWAERNATAAGCKYGQEEGYWAGYRYGVFSDKCQLSRHVDALYRQTGKAGSESQLKGSVLFIGDSLDRNLVNWIGEQFGQGAQDLTPFAAYKTPSGAVAQSSLNRRASVGDLHFANMYIFGVGEPPYPRRADLAQTDALHIRTLERVCIDAPRYLIYSPDVIVVNSAYWDTVQLCYGNTYAWRRRHDKNVKWPDCFDESKVNWEKFLLGYMQDVYRLLFTVQKCFSSTKTIVWRTAAEVAVDDRSPWFHVIPPHITAYLNNAARYAAQKNGFELINMDIMAAGRANDMQWTPNGLHQSTNFNREYLNVILNTLTGTLAAN